MSSESDRQEFARQACKDFIARTTVMLVPRNDPSDMGSGVVLRTNGESRSS